MIKINSFISPNGDEFCPKGSIGLLFATAVLSSLLLGGCSSDSPSVTDNFEALDTTPIEPEVEEEIPPVEEPREEEPPVLKVGVFIDSAVENIAYVTENHAGRTSSAGEFDYFDGDSIVFSIGDIDFPMAPVKAVLTPLDLVGATDINDTTVLNMARLLLSLDVDGDPDNGIQIGDDAHTQALSESIDFASDTFETDVVNLVANSGSVTTALVDATAAELHLRTTFNDFPTAVVGEDRDVFGDIADEDVQLVNEERVTLDGSASTDPDGRPLTYLWTIISSPDQLGCELANCVGADLLNPTSAQPTLIGMQEPGDYVVALTVNNGDSSSINTALVTLTLKKRMPTAQSMFGFALFSTGILHYLSRRRRKSLRLQITAQFKSEDI